MIVVKGKTISDAWHQIVYKMIQQDAKGNYTNAYVTDINSGSFSEQQRLQTDLLVVEVEYPDARPLAVTFPEGCGIPPVTDESTVEEYFGNYLMNPEIGKNEDYTYGNRLLKYPVYFEDKVKKKFRKPGKRGAVSKYTMNQVEWCIQHLKQFPHNNHCCITIPTASDLTLVHAPCLRSITLNIVEGRLNMSVVHRSWDIWSGFPTNMGGYQLLNEYICSELEGVETGKLFATSPGAHLYSMVWDLAKQRMGV